MVPAIFLDRDGVINENRPNHVLCWEDVELFPEALEALARIRCLPYKIIVISNQACIGRGLVLQSIVEEINRLIIREVEKAGGRIDEVFICPHRPEDRCDCRKPRPGLFFQASQAFAIDLGRSIMIGDALTDLQAGLAAGIPRVALVRTGRGKNQELDPLRAELPAFPIYDSLADALEYFFPSNPPNC